LGAELSGRIVSRFRREGRVVHSASETGGLEMMAAQREWELVRVLVEELYAFELWDGREGAEFCDAWKGRELLERLPDLLGMPLVTLPARLLG